MNHYKPDYSVKVLWLTMKVVQILPVDWCCMFLNLAWVNAMCFKLVAMQAMEETSMQFLSLSQMPLVPVNSILFEDKN